MRNNKSGNFAFIDSQNLHLGVREQGWSINYERLRIYLKVKLAYYKKPSSK